MLLWVMSCLCLLHSGGVLASASGDGSAKLWRFTEGKCTATLPDHQQPGEYLKREERDGGLWRAAVRVGLLGLCSVGLQLALWRRRPGHLLHGPHSQGLGCIQVK